MKLGGYIATGMEPMSKRKTDGVSEYWRKKKYGKSTS